MPQERKLLSSPGWDPQLKARLEDLVAAGEDWEARASGVLHPKKVHLGSWLALLQRPVLLSRP